MKLFDPPPITILRALVQDSMNNFRWFRKVGLQQLSGVDWFGKHYRLRRVAPDGVAILMGTVFLPTFSRVAGSWNHLRIEIEQCLPPKWYILYAAY